eukprot:616757-Pelagomonas_calceolata.AAC.1
MTRPGWQAAAKSLLPASRSPLNCVLGAGWGAYGHAALLRARAAAWCWTGWCKWSNWPQDPPEMMRASCSLEHCAAAPPQKHKF